MKTKIKLFFDPVGNTLTVWFGDPEQERLCEETGNDIILMKDRKGQVVGFEKLNFVPWEQTCRSSASKRWPCLHDEKGDRP